MPERSERNGYNYGNVKDSYSDATVDGKGGGTGGLCGYNLKMGKIENSMYTGYAYDRSNYTTLCVIGGICGKNYGDIVSCNNTGYMKGSNGNSNKYGQLAQCYIGGICGQNFGGILKSHNKGCFYALTYAGGTGNASVYLGGICGSNSTENASDYAVVQECSNTSVINDIHSGNYTIVGGICGRSSGGDILSCYNMGRIEIDGSKGSCSGMNIGGVCGTSGGKIIGNIIGYQDACDNTISNCYNRGIILCNGNNDNLGGICGVNSSVANSGTLSATSIIKNCYNIGKVYNVESNVCGGGICCSNYASIENCYYLENSSVDAVKNNDSEATMVSVDVKTLDDFQSGNVYGLFSQKSNEWIQIISIDDYPYLKNNIDSFKIEDIHSFKINKQIHGVVNKSIVIDGELQLWDGFNISSDTLTNEVSAIKWTSSDQSIVPDSEISCTGVNSYDNRSAELLISFTPHKEGKVIITGTASNGLTAYCEVTIEKTAIPTDFKLIADYLEGQIDKEYQIVGSLFLDTSGVTSEQIIKDELNGIIWESSDDSIASISKKSYELENDNYSASFILDIKTKKKGTVQITGKTMNGLSVSCKIKMIDTWKFTNSSEYFGNQGYYITGTDYQRLISNLTNVNRDNITNKHQSKTLYNVDNKGKAYTPWGGSCYGMSAWTCLVNSDLLKPSDVKKSSRIINEIEIDNGVKSAINYYMWQQALSVSQQEVKEFMTLSQKSQLEHLEVLAKQCEQGGNPIFIRFQWYDKFKSDNSCDKRSSHGHVVVGYGFEEGDWSSSMWGNISINAVFNKRILIYDCACPNNERYDLYYNDAGTWCIPGWGIVSTTSQSRDSKFNNGQLKLVTSEFADINLVDYVKGTVSPVVADNYGENILTALSDVDYSVNTSEGSADIVGFSVSNSTFNDPIVVSVDDSVTPDATLTTGNSSALLPQSSYYEVITDNSSMYFQLESQNHIATVGTNDSGTIKFGLNGSVNVQTDNMATTYVRLTTNDVEGKVFSYPTVEIQNDNTSETSLDIVEEGVIIKSNNLNGVVISAQNYDNGNAVNLMVDSDKDKLLISESGGSISVLEDSNNDGNYDAVIGTGKPDSKASYTITYDLNGGSVSGNPTNYTADTLPITLKNPTRNGYIFTGWTGSNGNTPQKTVTIAKSSTGNKSYTANWSKNQSTKTSIKSAKISLKKTSYVYDGKKKQPSVTVKVDLKKLKKGTDYKVTYKNNQKVGTASVIIRGTGKYTGKVTKKIQIVPKGTSVSKAIAKSKGFTVNWKKQTKSTDGYQLQYSTSKKFTKKTTITKTVKKSSKTKLDIKKCKAKKKYYIRIRTYKTVKGKKYCSGWSKIRGITTKK